MPTPPKSAYVLEKEGKSHRTKEELRQRKEAEQSLLTGAKLKENRATKEKEVAHKEFLRIKKLLKSIEKDDDIYGAVINRYCILRSEEYELIEHREKVQENILSITERLAGIKDEADYRDVCASLASLEKTYASLDRVIQAKRKMQAEIEKENAMTITSACRSINKKVDTGKDPLLEALSG